MQVLADILYFYFLYSGNKKCRSRRKKRTRRSWAAYKKTARGGKEIRRKWTRFRYFGVRIAHRWSRTSDLPHDSFFSSDESFHSHVRTSALTRVSIIDPSAARKREREHIYDVAWLQSQRMRLRRLSFPGNRTETESPLRERIIRIVFLLFPRKIENLCRYCNFRDGNSQLMYANIDLRSVHECKY